MTDPIPEDRLKILSQSPVPPADPAARTRALAAADLAFSEAQKKPSRRAQGRSLLHRLKSIVPARGNWTMDMRLPLGTAAVALLLLPIGWQLYTTTALTQPWLKPAGVTDTPVTPPTASQTAAPEPSQTVPADKAPAQNAQIAPRVETSGQVPPAQPIVPAQPAADAGQLAVTAPAAKTAQDSVSISSPNAGNAAGASRHQLSESDEAVSGPAVAATPPLMEAMPSAPIPSAPMSSGGSFAQSAASQSDRLAMPAPGFAAGTATPSVASEQAATSFAVPGAGLPTEPSGDTFKSFEESAVKVVTEAPVSTFSIDVDTASYSYVRSLLRDGYRPQADAVRIEEMINYFPYDYPVPQDASKPFQPTIAVYPTPWNAKTEILQIGIKGYVPPQAEVKPSNLVFLIDTSGSMDEPNKLPLLKRAFGLLVDQLGEKDTVSIVAYAGSAGVVLAPTRASDKAKILSALDDLSAGGSTAGAEGIELAYKLAEQGKIAGGTNRVILATDGDFNVGISDPDQLKDFIKTKRDAGIFLSVLGFGRGNLDDATMQALAENGNGNASYIDSYREAQKVLVEERGGTLDTIAKDVKIQVEFNPAFISEYRLIGYETRALNREDFNNDKVDAGEIGAGHTVTALYEITPKGLGGELVGPLHFGTAQPAAPAPAAGDLAYLKLRYKLPDSNTSMLMETPISQDLVKTDIAAEPDDMRFAAAVAAFGQKLKGSNYAGNITYEQIRQLALAARGPDDDGYRSEFVQMVKEAERLDASR